MKTYIYVAIGGFLGAISRFTVKNMHLFNYKGEFPLNTLVINITGSLMLAAILTLTLEVSKIGSEIKTGISVGFLGAYTTFSALCKELSGLMSMGDYGTAMLYVSLSVILGLTAVYGGIIFARHIAKRFARKS